MRAKDTILWEISGHNVQKSHLFGSFHIDVRNAPFTEDFLKAIVNNSTHLYTETALDIPFDPTILEPVHWKNLVSDKLRLKWLKILNQRYSLDIDSFFRLPPFILLNLIMVADLGSKNSLSMDQWFWKQAMENNLITLGLSSYRDHYNILTRITVNDQLIMLKKYLNSYSKSTRNSKSLLSLYQNGKIHQLFKYSAHSLGKYRSLMLKDRNISMAKRIIDSCRSENAMYVVGAAHLSGENGVISLLKSEKNLKLSPIFIG